MSSHVQALKAGARGQFSTPRRIRRGVVLSAVSAIALMTACGGQKTMPKTSPTPAPMQDARVGLKAGLYDAGTALSNMKLAATVAPPDGFAQSMNSDMTFSGNYVIQGNFNGLIVWDISGAKPELVKAFPCPASQNDVSVYRNLLFMSAEANNGRLDCGQGGAPNAKDRIRGIRIFDVSDFKNPKLIGNVQTCRGSHTHTVVEDPKDKDNVYIYISGSSGIRSADEVPGCSNASSADANSSRLRIEVIKVPLADPSKAAVVNRANIFSGLQANVEHGESKVDIEAANAEGAKARAAGMLVVKNPQSGADLVVPPQATKQFVDSIVAARGGTGAGTKADTAAAQVALQNFVNRAFGGDTKKGGAISEGSQCHDITVYPAIGLAGGACEGHGLLLDISNVTNPVRLDAVADSNFAYWHSATFNNDGTKLLFSDEWGGGGAPKCRATDKMEWGADAIFTIENKKLKFQSYYKIPTVQTNMENCVAHNGSLIPIPGRDVMVQAWYQGGISVFDWTDAAHPKEIASFDRGPVDATHMAMGGSWSVYWYNGKIVSSEIARGLDVAELTPSEFLSANEIDAAKTVKWNYLNAQGQPKISWPPSFPLVKAYTDQLERKGCVSAARIVEMRAGIAKAEGASGAARGTALNGLITKLDGDRSCDPKKVDLLKQALRDLLPAAM